MSDVVAEISLTRLTTAEDLRRLLELLTDDEEREIVRTADPGADEPDYYVERKEAEKDCSEHGTPGGASA